MWHFIIYILRETNGQLITQCLHHLNLWVKETVHSSHFLSKYISSVTETTRIVYSKFVLIEKLYLQLKVAYHSFDGV